MQARPRSPYCYGAVSLGVAYSWMRMNGGCLDSPLARTLLPMMLAEAP